MPEYFRRSELTRQKEDGLTALAQQCAGASGAPGVTYDTVETAVRASPGRPQLFRGLGHPIPAVQRWSPQYLVDTVDTQSNFWFLKNSSGQGTVRADGGGGHVRKSFREFASTDKFAYCEQIMSVVKVHPAAGEGREPTWELPLDVDKTWHGPTVLHDNHRLMMDLLPRPCNGLINERIEDLEARLAAGVRVRSETTGTTRVFIQLNAHQKQSTVWHRDEFDQIIVNIFGEGKTFIMGTPTANRRFGQEEPPADKQVHVHLKPGDVFYLPAYWRHSVKTTGPSCTVNWGFPSLTERFSPGSFDS